MNGILAKVQQECESAHIQEVIEKGYPKTPKLKDQIDTGEVENGLNQVEISRSNGGTTTGFEDFEVRRKFFKIFGLKNSFYARISLIFLNFRSLTLHNFPRNVKPNSLSKSSIAYLRKAKSIWDTSLRCCTYKGYN